MDDVLQQILAEIKDLKQGQTKMDAELRDFKQGLVSLKQDILTLDTKMDKGFHDLTSLINEAAKDAARTEKLLREHIEQPIH